MSGGTLGSTSIHISILKFRVTGETGPLQRLLQDIEQGRVDIVVCEALDRLARDGEDVAWIGKNLNYFDVDLHTISEGHVDHIKLAVAALLGAIFLKNLIDKTVRGMEAAVLAGRFAGGRAYGYKRLIQLDRKGELIRGYLEIDATERAIIERIFREFASGLSSIQIAKNLNEEGVSGPRGGAWNASTIRGDPKKLTGILNNPLYTGRLVWGRRQWRRNPDSEKRERRYRLRDRSEWTQVNVPDLRIIDNELWQNVRQEIEKRQRNPGVLSPAGQPRKRHLLSGLIKCSSCGSNYTISGKDYYRCAGQKERGTCPNKLSVRKGALEQSTLAILQNHLLTEDHTKLFVETFNREVMRLNERETSLANDIPDRLRVVELELANLSSNLLSGLISATLAKLITQKEAEKADLEAQLIQSTSRPSKASAEILPHPALLALFQEKVAALHVTLDDAAVRSEASEILDTLIESVTIYPDGANGPEAEVVAKVADLLAFATNDNAAPKGGVYRSKTVVAGAEFHRCRTRFRLNDHKRVK